MTDPTSVTSPLTSIALGGSWLGMRGGKQGFGGTKDCEATHGPAVMEGKVASCQQNNHVASTHNNNNKMTN